jgi:hypothetical protein
MAPEPGQFHIPAVMLRARIEPRAMDMDGQIGGEFRISPDPHANIGGTGMRDDHHGAFVIEQFCGAGAFVNQDEIGDIAEPMPVLGPIHMQCAPEKSHRHVVQPDDGCPRLEVKIILLPPPLRLTSLLHLVKPRMVVMVAIDGIHRNREASPGKSAGEQGGKKSEITRLNHGADAMLVPDTDKPCRQLRVGAMDIT